MGFGKAVKGAGPTRGGGIGSTKIIYKSSRQAQYLKPLEQMNFPPSNRRREGNRGVQRQGAGGSKSQEDEESRILWKLREEM